MEHRRTVHVTTVCRIPELQLQKASEIHESEIDESMEHRIDLYLIASPIEIVKVQPKSKR